MNRRQSNYPDRFRGAFGASGRICVDRKWGTGFVTQRRMRGAMTSCSSRDGFKFTLSLKNGKHGNVRACNSFQIVNALLSSHSQEMFYVRLCNNALGPTLHNLMLAQAEKMGTRFGFDVTLWQQIDGCYKSDVS